ncbi:hypothetical protein DSO57_1036569 [Entomophthora muscae]|uniref:Uncharacterized protein n=1 Tax=Entomophthora muscae TaxID=34485 RepID=A0ACC2RQ47_9FUNG|nr:hypothetical protein DSO57_1036569 [Entomophthora muscae]
MVLNPFGGFHEENVKLPIDKVPVFLSNIDFIPSNQSERARETDTSGHQLFMHCLPQPQKSFWIGSHLFFLLSLSDKSYYLNLWGGRRMVLFKR